MEFRVLTFYYLNASCLPTRGFFLNRDGRPLYTNVNKIFGKTFTCEHWLFALVGLSTMSNSSIGTNSFSLVDFICTFSLFLYRLVCDLFLFHYYIVFAWSSRFLHSFLVRWFKRFYKIGARHLIYILLNLWRTFFAVFFLFKLQGSIICVWCDALFSMCKRFFAISRVFIYVLQSKRARSRSVLFNLTCLIN